jgi:general secretion pathway protein E/type IV pilus assembly protein PilB
MSDTLAGPCNVAQKISELAATSGSEKMADVQSAINEALAMGDSPVGRLLEEQLVVEPLFLSALGQWLGLRYWEGPLPELARDALPLRLALQHRLYPSLQEGGGIILLASDPFDLAARQAVARACPSGVYWMLCQRRLIEEGLRRGFGIGAETFERLLEGRDADLGSDTGGEEVNVLDADDSEASVIEFVNQIIREALKERATDIHVEPLDDDLQIRYRIDGILHAVPVPPRIKELQASVVSRLKIMSRLDIAERRLPQDGRINLEFEGQAIDVRVATIPSVHGESVSLRLLGQQKFDFGKLGLDGAAARTVEEMLSMPNGIILVTGPTGCGKSTSLYTFLSRLNTRDRRIVTIEDPVENKLPGVLQIAVRPEINLTFAAGLRSILRGDPNIIMVGEMRDFETAEIAIRAALTGHLVFSTLHTNDSVGGITRLIDMGVMPFLVASSVRAFIAQRLVRRLCPHCSVPVEYDRSRLKQIGFPLDRAGGIRKAVGCEACRQTGFTGRAAIYEICTMSERMQELVTSNAPGTELRKVALEEGLVPLRQYGFDKIANGITTVEEVLRVTTAERVELLDE